MRITCDIAMDLAGLYLDHLASRDSVKAIKKHLRGCPSCCRYYRSFLQEKGEHKESDALEVPCNYMEQYGRLSSRIRKRRNLSIAVMAAIVCAGAGMMVKGALNMRKNERVPKENQMKS